MFVLVQRPEQTRATVNQLVYHSASYRSTVWLISNDSHCYHHIVSLLLADTFPNRFHFTMGRGKNERAPRMNDTQSANKSAHSKVGRDRVKFRGQWKIPAPRTHRRMKNEKDESNVERVQINRTEKQTNHHKLDKETCNALKSARTHYKHSLVVLLTTRFSTKNNFHENSTFLRCLKILTVFT